MAESPLIYTVACPISSSTRKSVITSNINWEIQDLDKKIFSIVVSLLKVTFGFFASETMNKIVKIQQF